MDLDGGNAQQLSFHDEKVGTLRRAPTDDRLIWAIDAGGDELHQFWLLEPGGTPRALTTNSAVMHNFGGWSPDGTRIALDPDIPPASQRVMLRAHQSREAAQARWWIDGREAGRGARLAWFPMPGVHRISLRDAAGNRLDEVEIEVRGATLRAALSEPRPPRAPPPR